MIKLGKTEEVWEREVYTVRNDIKWTEIFLKRNYNSTKFGKEYLLKIKRLVPATCFKLREKNRQMWLLMVYSRHLGEHKLGCIVNIEIN